MDTEIRKRIAKQLHRGKIDLNIFIEFNGQNAPSTINTSVVKSYMDQLKTISDGSESEMMAIAMRLPDTLSSERETLQETEKEAVYTLIGQVLKTLKITEKMREMHWKKISKNALNSLKIISSL